MLRYLVIYLIIFSYGGSVCKLLQETVLLALRAVKLDSDSLSDPQSKTESNPHWYSTSPWDPELVY